MQTRPRLLSSLGAILLAASGVIVAGAPPATAAHAHHINRYVALGDSFAAGQGAGPYLNKCLQSANGYPALLDAVKGVKLLRNASCSGATTGDVRTTQLSKLNKRTTLVTLTVGGNDVDVAGVAATCTANPSECPAAITAAQGRLQKLAVDLKTTYSAIKAASPNARVLVTGYPYLFDTTVSDPSGLIAPINGATSALNATIQGAVSVAGKNFHFVGVSIAFKDHGILSTAPWINYSFDPAHAADRFHPNAAGYVAYEHELQAALRVPAVKKAPCRTR